MNKWYFAAFLLMLAYSTVHNRQTMGAVTTPPTQEQAPAVPEVVTVFVTATPEPAPVSVGSIMRNQITLSGFYATGNVWCFQSPACQHLGVDIMSADGTYGEPVYAPLHATVTMVDAYYDPARAGQYVIMALDDGCELYLGHLQAVPVSAGQEVYPGTFLGRIGPDNHEALGWPGPHTHVQLTCGGVLMDWEAYDAQH